MRKRIEISYLTFLGLSLTVVITACKDRTTETPFFSISTTVDNHVRELASNELVDFLKANKKECGTFVFDDNYLPHKALHQTTQLLVYVGQRFITDFTFPHIPSVFYPDRLVGLLSLNLIKIELCSLTSKYLPEITPLLSNDIFDTYRVRAGPLS